MQYQLGDTITINGRHATVIGLDPTGGKVWALLDNGVRVWRKILA